MTRLSDIFNFTFIYTRFCSKPDMMGLPTPTKQYMPEFGIQYDFAKLLSSLTKTMKDCIVSSLAHWDSSQSKPSIQPRSLACHFCEALIASIALL